MDNLLFDPDFNAVREKLAQDWQHMGVISDDKTPPPILERAMDITSGDRRRDYGRPLINHIRIAVKWAGRIAERVRKGLPLITPSVVVELMLDLKDARQENTPKFDNLLDKIGYVACLDDMARQLVEMDYAVDYEAALTYLDRMSFSDMRQLLVKLEDNG
jgi:hypothetical protein